MIDAKFFARRVHPYYAQGDARHIRIVLLHVADEGVALSGSNLDLLPDAPADGVLGGDSCRPASLQHRRRDTLDGCVEQVPISKVYGLLEVAIDQQLLRAISQRSEVRQADQWKQEQETYQSSNLGARFSVKARAPSVVSRRALHL